MDHKAEAAVDRTDDNAATASSRSHLFERTIVGVLTLLAAGVRTFFRMLVSPSRFARGVVDNSPDLAPPYSFLITSLLLAGISIRMAVAFFERTVDYSLLSRLAHTVGSITLEDVFVLTVPCVFLVAMAGAGVARWTRPGIPFQDNSVVRSVCYAAGFQFLCIAATCLIVLVSKVILSTSSALPPRMFDEAVFVGVALLLFLSAMSVFRVIRMDGTTVWAHRRIAAASLSGLVAVTILLGVAITNSISFDLESTIQEVRQRHQRENLDDVRIAVRTLASRIVQDELGQPAIEMNIAMVNVSDEAVVVPRPFELQHAWQSGLQPIHVLSCSTDLAEDPGWVIEPGKTCLVHWMLDVPQWCRETKYQHTALPILFDCFPLHGTDDVFRTHPIGEAAIVSCELSWPMFEARRDGNQQAVDRIAEMMDGTVFR